MTLHCTVEELGARMGSAAFGRWLAFMEAEEVGPKFDRDRVAEVLAALHNGPLTRKSKALWRARDFLPDPWSGPKQAPKPAGAADARAHIAQQRAAMQEAKATADAKRKR